jgi:hypothetical protein
MLSSVVATREHGVFVDLYGPMSDGSGKAKAMIEGADGAQVSALAGEGPTRAAAQILAAMILDRARAELGRLGLASP